MTWRRVRRLVCMLVICKVLLHLPQAARAHHGVEGIAASILLDAALSSSGGCNSTES